MDVTRVEPVTIQGLMFSYYRTTLIVPSQESNLNISHKERIEPLNAIYGILQVTLTRFPTHQYTHMHWSISKIRLDTGLNLHYISQSLCVTLLSRMHPHNFIGTSKGNRTPKFLSERNILSVVRLPISPSRYNISGSKRIRTLNLLQPASILRVNDNLFILNVLIIQK